MTSLTMYILPPPLPLYLIRTAHYRSKLFFYSPPPPPTPLTSQTIFDSTFIPTTSIVYLLILKRMNVALLITHSTRGIHRFPFI